MTASGIRNVSPKRWLNRCGDVARELDVLALVVADRDEIGLVEEDVARHQHGVREERGRDELVR